MFELLSICGQWKFQYNTHWEFVVDAEKAGSLSVIERDISFNDLVKVVFDDYGLDSSTNTVKISYRLPSPLLSATQDNPPLFIRNDRQLKSFLNKLEDSEGVIKLCVTFIKNNENEHTSHDGLEESVTAPAPRLGGEESNIPCPSHVHVAFEDSTSAPAAYVHAIERQSSYNSLSSGIRGKSKVSECPSRNENETSCNSSFSDIRGKAKVSEPPPAPSETNPSLHSVFVGMLFKDKNEMSRKMQMLAMKHSFEFRVKKSDLERYVLHCVDQNCSWKFRACSLTSSQGWIVRHYSHMHSCDSSLRNVNHRQATAKTLGKMICNHYDGGKIGLKPKQIIEKVRNDNGVVISYTKAWRAQEYAQELARGSPADSYKLLPRWFHMLRVKNPGSATYLEIDSASRFKYAFFSLGASIRGFRLMKKVICIDGAFLKAKFKGTLLGATAQDGNFNLYPVAFGVVDSENDASWSWFFRCLRSIIPDEQDLVFVSDRAPSIANALSANYPCAHHSYCSFHFEKNILIKCKNTSLVSLVKEAAKAFTESDFSSLFSAIQSADPSLADYLIQADVKKWSRVFCPVNRYNIMTSNLAESLNSMLNLSREYPIVCLFETIRSTLTRWFQERYEFASKHIQPITLEVVERMTASYNVSARFYEVFPINSSEFEVKGDLRNHVVNLETRQCTCRVFDVIKIPCSHAIAAAKHVKVDEYNLVHDFYSTERWKLAYSESIYPVGDEADWNIPPDVANLLCLPPCTRIPSGRPKKKRISCVWEFGKSRPKPKVYKCSRCGQSGHNKNSCVAAI